MKELNFRNGISQTEARKQFSEIFTDYSIDPAVYKEKFLKQDIVIENEGELGKIGEFIPEGYLIKIWNEQYVKWLKEKEKSIKKEEYIRDYIQVDSKECLYFFDLIVEMFPDIDYTQEKYLNNLKFAFKVLVDKSIQKKHFYLACKLFTESHKLTYWKPAHIIDCYLEILKENAMIL